jgi:hypothetical protein
MSGQIVIFLASLLLLPPLARFACVGCDQDVFLQPWSVERRIRVASS